MKTDLKRIYRGFILVCPFVIILLFICQMIFVSRFNAREYVVRGVNQDNPTYFKYAGRGDSTSEWLKRDFDLNGEKVDLKGQTIDGVLYNHSEDLVSQWTLRINIRGDCYINNAWCGTVEIHQAVGTEDEKVQKLDLRNYKLEEVELDYVYDGDLLIPLSKGDYVIYFPSLKDNEIPAGPHSELTTGVIFYYLDTLDLNNIDLSFYYHRDITNGTLYYIVITLLMIWLVNLIIYLTSIKIYEDTLKELELKKSGISSMSDIYDVIYIVDIVKNEIVSVVSEVESDLKRPEDMGANEQFKNLFNIDCTESFKENVLEFVDISTLSDRMKGKKNITCEYMSKFRGWCRIHFFAMDYVEGQPVDRVVFALQIIDDEKREKDSIVQKISDIESEKEERINLFRNLAENLIYNCNETLSQEQHIIDESKEETIREYAIKSKRGISKTSNLLKDLVEFLKIDNGFFAVEEKEYDFNAMVKDIEENVKPELEGSQITFNLNVQQPIRSKLYGDGERIRYLIHSLILNSLDRMDTGEIKLVVFSKKHDDSLHLVISVRDNGTPGMHDNAKFRLGLADKILVLMGSKLHIIEDPEGGNDTYFEIDQMLGGQ
ncbi:MAG: HAMP domain-containing histidine kinase [Oribacterium sp.]|nr:HAMP domain-containing histidine kinase [Oribacterium sp.]